MYDHLYRPADNDVESRFVRFSADRRAFERAADALYRGGSSPAVQAAVFTAMRRIPGVQLRPDAVDVARRTGLALVYEDDGGFTQLVFDRDSYRYLGVNRMVAPSRSWGPDSTVLALTRQAVSRVAIWTGSATSPDPARPSIRPTSEGIGPMSVCLLWTMRVLAAVAGLALAGCGGQKSPEVATAQEGHPPRAPALCPAVHRRHPAAATTTRRCVTPGA